MVISRLGEHVTFEVATTTVDANANHMSTWEPYFTCHAYAVDSSYAEKQAAGVTVADEGLVFTVRYCSELAVLSHTGYRVRFHDEPYNIEAIDWMNFQHKTIKVTCTKERRES